MPWMCFANRGYAALSVNFRSSTGLGKAFTNAGDKEWGGKIRLDQVDAVAWAISQGIADRGVYSRAAHQSAARRGSAMEVLPQSLFHFRVSQ